MGIITSANILLQASYALNDLTHQQWPREELLLYLEDGQRAAVLLRPAVNPVTIDHPMVAGSKQMLPDDGYVLLDVVRNVDGDSVSPTSRKDLDQVARGWHQDDPGPTVNFLYDVRNRKTFYVSPPHPGPPGEVELIYAQIPPAFARESDGSIGASTYADTLKIDDIYAPALIAYVLHRAYIKDTAAQGASVQKSQQYAQYFAAMITGNAEQKDNDIVIRHEVGEGAR